MKETDNLKMTAENQAEEPEPLVPVQPAPPGAGAALARIFQTHAAGMAHRRFVAQISNLLYRRLPVGRALEPQPGSAGWKPAIQQIGNLRYAGRPALQFEMSGLKVPSISRF